MYVTRIQGGVIWRFIAIRTADLNVSVVGVLRYQMTPIPFDVGNANMPKFYVT